MAETPYVYVEFPKCLYAPDGTVVVVQDAAEAAAYPEYAASPAGPWPVPTASPAPTPAPKPARKR